MSFLTCITKRLTPQNSPIPRITQYYAIHSIPTIIFINMCLVSPLHPMFSSLFNHILITRYSIHKCPLLPIFGLKTQALARVSNSSLAQLAQKTILFIGHFAQKQPFQRSSSSLLSTSFANAFTTWSLALSAKTILLSASLFQATISPKATLQHLFP